MSTYKNGVFQYDGGNVLTITEFATGVNSSQLENGGRYLINFDILRNTGESQTAYNVKINRFYTAVTSPCIVKSTMTAEQSEQCGNDAVGFNGGSFSGGYVNLEMLIVDVKGAKHEFSLVYDDIASTSDTLHFELRHNANIAAGTSMSGAEITADYGSFPIHKIVSATGKQTVPVVIHSNWYTSDSDYSEGKTTASSIKGVYYTEVFVQEEAK